FQTSTLSLHDALPIFELEDSKCLDRSRPPAHETIGERWCIALRGPGIAASSEAPTWHPNVARAGRRSARRGGDACRRRPPQPWRSEEHTSELQSRGHL